MSVMERIPFYPAIKRQAEFFGLCPSLVAAVCRVESGFRPWAWRHEPGFEKRYVRPWVKRHLGKGQDKLQMALLSSSLGLMQVMGLVAVELGCKPGKVSRLFIPEIGLWYGCRKLRQLMKRYGGNMEDAVAAYNAGSKRWLDYDHDGIKDEGEPYRNERYVTRVMKYMEEFKKMEEREGH